MRVPELPLRHRGSRCCCVMMLAVVAGIILGTVNVSAQGPGSDTVMRIIALGDMPYGRSARSHPLYEALIRTINDRNPELVIHVGDTKGGGACTNAILDRQLAFMNMFKAPVLYTPGDNEWTDCFRQSGGSDNPLERLDYIRKKYFAEPGRSLGGAPVPLEHQGEAGYPENARYIHKDIMFVTAHVVGSNNNFEVRDITAVKEFFARSMATTAWLKESFAKAKDVKVVVLAIHADMFEFDFNEFKREGWLRHSGFLHFGEALQRTARDFSKPVLLLFGDSHIYRRFKPFPKVAPNVTAVEVFGHRDMHAVEISIDTGSAMPFSVTPVWNPAIERDQQ